LVPTDRSAAAISISMGTQMLHKGNITVGCSSLRTKSAFVHIAHVSVCVLHHVSQDRSISDTVVSSLILSQDSHSYMSGIHIMRHIQKTQCTVNGFQAVSQAALHSYRACLKSDQKAVRTSILGEKKKLQMQHLFFFKACRAAGNVNWIKLQSMILNHFLISGCCQSPAKV